MKSYLMFPSHLLRPGIEIPITFVLLSRLSFFLQTTFCQLLFPLELAGIGACLHKPLLPLLLQTFFIELRIHTSARSVGGYNYIPDRLGHRLEDMSALPFMVVRMSVVRVIGERNSRTNSSSSSSPSFRLARFIACCMFFRPLLNS